MTHQCNDYYSSIKRKSLEISYHYYCYLSHYCYGWSHCCYPNCCFYCHYCLNLNWNCGYCLSCQNLILS